MSKKGSVLVIDDEEIIRNLFQRLLSRQGYDFHAAENGQAGLEAIKDFSPDLVFVDLKMPGMDGMDVLRKAKEINSNLPIIILTGHGDLDSAVQAVKLGAYDFMRKPIEDLEALLIEIDRAIESYGLIKRNEALSGELKSVNLELEKKVKMRTADLNKTLDELKQAQAKINEEIKMVSVVQQGLLPESPPKRDGLDMAAVYLASSAVGGDYYDYIDLGDDKMAIVIADVSGHGLAAGFVMTMVKIMLLYLNKQKTPLLETVEAVNDVLSQHIPTNNFVTMIYGILDLKAKTFTFINAGHDPLVKINSVSKEIETFEAGSPFLGIDSDTVFSTVSINLEKNEKLIFYTDGIVEAINSKEEAFGEKKFNELVTNNASLSSMDLITEIISTLSDHCQGTAYADDITLVVLGLT